MNTSFPNMKDLVYRSQPTDIALRSLLVGTRRFHVKYFVEHKLSSADKFLCLYISSFPEGRVQTKELGYNLGFDIENNPEKDSFYDEAEDHLYKMILEEVQKWGLIEISNNVVKLTDLGRLSISSGKKYAFYEADADVLEWKSIRNAEGNGVLFFPFVKELGISANYIHKRQLPFEDTYVAFIQQTDRNELIQNLQIQTAEDYIVFEANYAKNPFLGIVTAKVDVDLLQDTEGNYSITFRYGNNECTILNCLYRESINQNEFNKTVKRALYTKLMNDESAILDYQALSPFEDILEIENLLTDHRLDWNDSVLFKLIASNCNADNWRILSRYCDINAIEQSVEEYQKQLDWSTLTLRLSDDFIVNHYHDYPWETQLFTARKPISTSLIEFSLQNYNFENGKDDGQWDWEEIIPLLNFDFIKNNITLIPFDLSLYTRNIKEEQRFLIIEHPEAAWDWNYISMEYPVDFLLNNISCLAGYVNLCDLLDRVFTDSTVIDSIIKSVDFKKAIKDNHDNLIKIYTANNKRYQWSDSVIRFFEETSLILWNSTQYSLGFSRNPSLVWDREFFINHYKDVTNDNDCSYISANIIDNSVIDLAPNFNWDWNLLSKNKVIYDDYDFVRKHTDKINANLVVLNCSSKLIELYFDILDIGSIMLNDIAVQSKVTDSVSIDFIKEKIKCNWDWCKVTRRVYNTIKIDIIGRELWRNKWDWNFLSQKLAIGEILDYAKAYSDRWNWEYVLKRVDIDTLIKNGKWQEIFEILSVKEDSVKEWNYLSSSLPVGYILTQTQYLHFWNWNFVLGRTSEGFLLSEGIVDKIKFIINQIENPERLWEIITEKFSTVNLIEIIRKYSDNSYLWRYSILYSRHDFDAKKYLDENNEYIKWGDFSASDGVNKLFAKAKNKKTRALWLRIFKDYLENPKYNWDFSKMSHLSNILQEPRLFQLDKDWDWDYVSEHASWISFTEGENYFVNKYKDTLNFQLLSSRIDINLTEDAISKFENKGYKWDWHALTNNNFVNYSLKFIKEHIEKPWNWELLSNHPELNNEFVKEYKDKKWNWAIVTARDFFEPSIDILQYIINLGKAIDWKKISLNPKLSLEVIEHYAEYIDWGILIRDNKSFNDIAPNLVHFIKQFESHIIWQELNQRIGQDVPSELINAYPEEINWRNASQSQLINFDVDFVKRYLGKWFWSELINNLKFQRDIPAYKVIFKKQVITTKFIERLQTKVPTPYIYHFTHFYNAIEVIKAKKILSRDRAKELGLLRFDSAGSVVLRSSLAHPYARFYFRPCTPTQYYNEALGADSKLGEYRPKHICDEFGNEYWIDVFKSKYPKALNLGLPKCPVPVFFRFDIEEVLSTMPESCFYSDRNMQSNNPHVYKVLEHPESLCVDYLYDTMANAKQRAKYSGGWNVTEIDNYMKYSQQEFLVKSEFDFSGLKSLKIICYDDQYTDILRRYFADDPICQKIYSYKELNEYELFEKENRSISLSTQMDTSRISTDFMDDYYFDIIGEDLSSVKFDLSCAEVLYEIPPKEIHVKGVIKWTNTNTPFDIFFHDPKARTKDWLIYSNHNGNNSFESKFKVEKEVKEWIDTFENSLSAISLVLNKNLFNSHMLNSYHGIAHTARVLFASYLLSHAINLGKDESNACYIAAIIHDLGKNSDREGAEHGYNSMNLYRDYIYETIHDTSLAVRVLQAVQYHSVADKDCPTKVQNDIIWKVLKDADALDRSRFPGRGCDKSFLRLGIYYTPIGQNIIDLTTYLPIWTQDAIWDNPYNELVNNIKSMTI